MFIQRNLAETPFIGVDGPNKFNGTVQATPHLIDINGRPALFINGQKTITAGFGFRYGIDTEFYYFNRGQYEFVQDNLFSNPVNQIPKSWIGGHATFADFDNDGNSELIWSFYNGLSSLEGQAEYFKLDANGVYRPLANPFTEVNREGDFQIHAALDIDGDNDLDAIFQNGETRNIAVYRNDAGTFTRVDRNLNLGIPLTDLEKVYSFDEDNDGDYDVVVENSSGNFSLYRNDNGTYTSQSGENNPFSSLDGSEFKTSFTDLDRDGDIDVLFLDDDGKPVYYENLKIDGNKPPLVINDRGKVLSDLFSKVNVLDNDWEWERETLKIVQFEGVTELGGTIFLDDNDTPDDTGDDQLIYSSPTEITEDTTDSFVYTVEDTAGNQRTATVNIQVDFDEAPIAEADAVNVFADVPGKFNVLRNDREPNSQQLKIIDFDTTSNFGGKVTLDDNGTPDNFRDDELIYTAPDWIVEVTEDSFSYTITDDTGNTSTATVNVTVSPRLFTLQPETNNPFAGLDAGLSSVDRDFATPALGDIDGDGDLDLVSGNSDAEIRYFRNDNGSFIPQTGTDNPFNRITVGGRFKSDSSIGLGDFDGDGDIDLVATNKEDLDYRYWRNDNGDFTQLRSGANPVRRSRSKVRNTLISTVDWDDDGDEDFITGGEFRSFRLFKNQNGILQDVPATASPFESFLGQDYQNLDDNLSPVAIDFDRDGDQDLLIGEQEGTIFAYRNDGFDQWTALTGADHPLGEDIDVIADDFIEHLTLALGDIDGDGDPDLVTGQRDGTFLYWENTLYNRFNNPVTPVALDDRISLTTGDSTTIDILNNDRDPNGGNIEVTDYDPTTELGGTVSLDNNNTPNNATDDKLIYTAPTGINRETQDTFTYTITADNGTTAKGTVKVNLTPPPNPNAGITLTASDLPSTTEAGGSNNFTLVLDSKPTADVRIHLSNSDRTEATLSNTSLTFTPNNYDTPQTITVTGIDDELDDGAIEYSITSLIDSEDLNYSAIAPVYLTLTNQDNETNSPPPDNPNPNDPPRDSLLNTSINRFQNRDISGTYLFAGEDESENIKANFPNFIEEGLAFKVADQPGDDLIPLYRFQSLITPGTYLLAAEAERQSIKENFADSFNEEGLAFYVYGVGTGKGTEFIRFQNESRPGTYLFAAEQEAENIRNNFPNFIEEGTAFEVAI